MAETTVSWGERTGSRKALLLHDGISFAVLLLVSGVLFTLTLLLFRSFEEHRADLAKRWSARGAAELHEGQPARAIVPLRAALSYAPDDAQYQMLLAEALAAAGKTEEATNYFLNLWEARPADSEINLQLARLARAHGDVGQAAEYYRAAIFGIWPNHALEQRRAVRYELAAYLAQQGDKAGARAELLTAVAAAPDTEELDLELGHHLEALGDEQDALGLYRKAMVREPKDGVAMAAAGEAAYAMGDYLEASRLLRRSRDAKTHGGMTAEAMNAMVQDADRMVALSLSRDLPAGVRAEHLRAAGVIARARLDACVATQGPIGSVTATAGPAKPQPAATVSLPAAGAHAGVTGQQAAGTGSDLEALETQWKAMDTPAARRSLLTDAAAQDAAQDLIFSTERLTAAQCGPATGDDGRLLKMAEAAQAEAQH